MTHNKIARNIKLYRWSMTLMEPFFWGPILIFYIQHAGHMSLPEIYFMEAVVIFGCVILEIPSGALADMIGRKKTILAGSLFLVLSVIGFALITSPIWVWAMNVMWMFGFSLRSGADSAFLYDSLKELGKENDYQKIQGAVVGNRLFIMAIAALVTGFLAEIDIRLPAILSIPAVVIASALTFFFTEPVLSGRNHFKRSAGKLKSVVNFLKEQFGLMKFSVLFVANHKAVKWIILFATLVGVASKVWFFTYNPYFELVDLDLRFYGIMFFLFNIIAWLFSRYAYRIEKKVPEYNLVVIIILLIGLPIFIMGTFVIKLAISLMLFQNVVRGFMSPFFGGFINKHLDSGNRATVLSIKSAVSGLAQFISLGLFGFMLGILPLDVNLQILGIITLVLGIFSIYTYRKIFPRA